MGPRFAPRAGSSATPHADTMSERVAEDEREQKEKDLDYLDEDQDD